MRGKGSSQELLRARAVWFIFETAGLAQCRCLEGVCPVKIGFHIRASFTAFQRQLLHSLDNYKGSKSPYKSHDSEHVYGSNFISEARFLFSMAVRKWICLEARREGTKMAGISLVNRSF